MLLKFHLYTVPANLDSSQLIIYLLSNLEGLQTYHFKPSLAALLTFHSLCRSAA